jgi:nucleotide-binding universal stress UspA family protein
MKFDHVLLPLDGSDFSAAALPTARALAERFDAKLVPFTVANRENEARVLRDEVLASIGEDGPGEALEMSIADDPARGISSQAEELAPCVTCMSTTGRGRVAGAVLGSVARAVLTTTEQPLVAVGPSADRPSGLVGRPPRRPAAFPDPLSTPRLVACVNGPESETVLPFAADWAAALQMQLAIVTVAEDAPPTLDGERVNRFGPTDPESYVKELAERWRDTVPDTVGQVVVDPIGVASGLRLHLSHNPAGLVAVTTHARSGLQRVRLGAVAADIVRTSPCPTLVVPLLAP